MPRKPQPHDWDRYFGPRAQRRRGPLGLLGFTMLAGGMLAALIIAGNVGVRAYTVESATRDRLTITPLWATAYARHTMTAATTTTQVSITPTTQAKLLIGRSSTNGNVRSEPRIAAENILGQLAPDDVVAVLEANPPVNPQWYRVRITTTVGSLKVGTEGWVSAKVLMVPASATPSSAGTTQPK